MRTVQKSLRIPEDTLKEINRITCESGRNFSAIAKDLLTEAIKMRRCPGIIFKVFLHFCIISTKKISCPLGDLLITNAGLWEMVPVRLSSRHDDA